MAERIRIRPTAPGTSDWRAELGSSGHYLCDVRLEISSMLNASRYYIQIDGEVRREGIFNFDSWDAETIEEILTKVVHILVPNAAVEVAFNTARARKSA